MIKSIPSMVLSAWLLLLMPGPVTAGAGDTVAGSPPPGVTQHKAGDGARAAWVFLPERPHPEPYPVVIFLHGYRALDPYDYGAWIDHLVRRGNLVIYPIYEATRGDDRQQLLEQAADGIRAALVYLAGAGVSVDRQRFAATGHSLGGGMSILLGARAAELGLPPMRAVMPVQAGSKGGQGFPVEVYRELPDCLLLVVDGDRDQFADSRMGRAVIAGTDGVAPEHKAYVVLQSDPRANPPLIADHYAPLAPHAAYRLEPFSAAARTRQRLVKWLMRIRDGEVDALDTEALWPLMDGLFTEAFQVGPADLPGRLARTAGKGVLWRQP